MSTKVIELNDSNFDKEVLRASEPVLVEFGAEWSSSCQAMATHLNSVAEEEAATVKVAKLDVDRSPTLASRYGVRAVPTLLVFHQGVVRDQIVGAATAAGMRAALAACVFQLALTHENGGRATSVNCATPPNALSWSKETRSTWKTTPRNCAAKRLPQPMAEMPQPAPPLEPTS